MDSGAPLSSVELVTDEGIEILIYGPGPGYEVVDYSFVPAVLVDEES